MMKMYCCTCRQDIEAEYHTAEIRCIEEARRIYRLIKRIKDNG
jgi:hypothetical protein